MIVYKRLAYDERTQARTSAFVNFTRYQTIYTPHAWNKPNVEDSIGLMVFRTYNQALSFPYGDEIWECYIKDTPERAFYIPRIHSILVEQEKRMFSPFVSLLKGDYYLNMRHEDFEQNRRMLAMAPEGTLLVPKLFLTRRIDHEFECYARL